MKHYPNFLAELAALYGISLKCARAWYTKWRNSSAGVPYSFESACWEIEHDHHNVKHALSTAQSMRSIDHLF